MMLHAYYLRIPTRGELIEVRAPDPFVPAMDGNWEPQRVTRRLEDTIQELKDKVTQEEQEQQGQEAVGGGAEEEQPRSEAGSAEPEEQRARCQQWLAEWALECLHKAGESCRACPSEPINTTTITTDPDLVLTYSLEEFNLCLSNDVLMGNLEALLDLPLPVEFQEVMKEKVDQVYPSGIPEKQLRRLGQLARRYSGEEISRWSVTSSGTLAALLDPSGGNWNDSQVQQLVSRYLTLDGTLTGPLLQEIGGRRLCHLREEQMEKIPAKAIRTAGQLNISACSQSKKELLYRKAQEAFASLAGTPSLYYCRLQPYLGGAPAEDLKYLANAGVAIDMDIDTFLSLNPEELQLPVVFLSASTKI
ncbi:hypothetical protein BTVI_128663 [Pitangus sulphuratus]|nr:hypothetical protein BTVI_128663 [Pitangus sulphuratus]